MCVYVCDFYKSYYLLQEHKQSQELTVDHPQKQPSNFHNTKKIATKTPTGASYKPGGLPGHLQVLPRFRLPSVATSDRLRAMYTGNKRNASVKERPGKGELQAIL